MTIRVKLEVYVDLDRVPGTFHSKESARNVVSNILQQQIPHYNPMVATTDYYREYVGFEPEQRQD